MKKFCVKVLIFIVCFLLQSQNLFSAPYNHRSSKSLAPALIYSLIPGGGNLYLESYRGYAYLALFLGTAIWGITAIDKSLRLERDINNLRTGNPVSLANIGETSDSMYKKFQSNLIQARISLYTYGGLVVVSMIDAGLSFKKFVKKEKEFEKSIYFQFSPTSVSLSLRL